MILHDAKTIREYTGAGWWGNRTLLDTLREQVAAHPERLSIVDPADRMELVGTEPQRKTWAEAGTAVEAIATRLIELGLKKDDVVILHLPNTWELMVLYFGVCMAGGLPSPLAMQWRQHELAHVAETTQARFYIAADAFKGTGYLELVDKLAPGKHCIEHRVGLAEVGRWAQGPVRRQLLDAVRIDPNDVFTLCWTSGTESLPKGTPVSHNNWFFQAGRVLGLLDVRDGDRILCAAPIVNMTGVGAMMLPWLFRAGTMILHHPLNLELFVRQLASEGVQFSSLVPALLNMIVKLPNVDQLDLSHIRTLAVGSAPPSAYSIAEFKRRWGIEIINLWGQNEGTALVGGPHDVPDATQRVDHLPWWGHPDARWKSNIPGVRIKIVGEDGQIKTQPGEVGELAYRGPNVFPGYFKRPEANAKSFDAEGYLYTGDTFKILDGHYLGFFDRKKDIIIRGGFNISAAEVENMALAYPGIVDCAAVAVPDEILGEKVCLCAVARDKTQPPTLEAVVAWMRERGFGTYKLPEYLKVVDAIPRNPVGKILKRELRDSVKV
jgi:acyl-CoA synthetase (AMP-forming)/AMP-acid ligase II